MGRFGVGTLFLDTDIVDKVYMLINLTHYLADLEIDQKFVLITLQAKGMVVQCDRFATNLPGQAMFCNNR